MSRNKISLSKSRRYSVQLIDDMPPSSTLNAVKRRLCQVFSPVATKIHAATQIHSRPQTADETSQEHNQRFTELVRHATRADSTSVTCQVTIILFIKHLFSTEIKKQSAGIKALKLEDMS